MSDQQPTTSTSTSTHVPGVQPSATPEKRLTRAEAMEKIKASGVTYQGHDQEKPKPKQEVKDAVKFTAPSKGGGETSTKGDPSSTKGGEDEALELEEKSNSQVDSSEFAKKYQELEASPDLPEELFSKHVTVKLPNGKEEAVTIKELRDGYLRRNNHSKMMNEVTEMRRKYESQSAQEAKLWNDFKSNPDMAFELLTERFGEDHIAKITERYQKTRESYEAAIMEAGLAAAVQLGLTHEQASSDPRVLQVMQQRKAMLDSQKEQEKELKRLRKEHEAYKAKENQAQEKSTVEDFSKSFSDSLKRFGDAALKAEGIRINSLSKERLASVVARVMLANGSSSMTLDVVREAAQIMREDLEDEGKTPTKPLPSLTGQGGGMGSIGSTKQERMTRVEAMRQIKGK